jgi:hypothetical protein
MKLWEAWGKRVREMGWRRKLKKLKGKKPPHGKRAAEAIKRTDDDDG